MTNATQMQTHSARRINHISSRIGCQKYLEVGVNAGQTFLGVDIPRKVAVDPKFRFDVSKHQSEQVEFFQVTSDEFFVNHAGDEKFDIIFLDGLHTFEQTFRDFCNSLLHCHDRTIWVIDDTVPSDVFSALKDQDKAVSYRRTAGGQSGAWHGDIFKMVFAICDFFPCFSYCTANTKGNPQTFVWKRPRRNFKPVYNNLETISRLGYFDFVESSPVFNYLPEEDALEYLLASLPE